ncbi:MAG: ATPase [Clostridia bacterium]|nr:ATPase [Clostridia bacterium]
MNYKETYLGIEFGSTRIKSVLIDKDAKVLAQGSFVWENKYIDGVWTYSKDDMIYGMQESYKDLAQNVREKYGETLTTVGAIGISSMMHGYIALDKNYEFLTPSQTWRNVFNEPASEELSALFNFKVPQRWTVSQFYQAILNKKEHIKDVEHIFTLSTYIHFLLTGSMSAGLGEASGIFPIDFKTHKYNVEFIDKFNKLLAEKGFAKKAPDIFPKEYEVGECAGTLTNDGAILLDPSGNLQSGIPLCPPEGDADTGMIATNTIKNNTGSVSAGTSVFTILVLDKIPKNYYREIDILSTPDGKPTALVQCNNCTADIDAWVNIFYQFAKSLNPEISLGDVYKKLFDFAEQGDLDCGGLLSYNYYSGELITKMQTGKPIFIRNTDSEFNLQNFMRMNLMSAVATMKMGMDILKDKEDITPENLLGHGGYFKNSIGQKIMAAALQTEITTLETASEGGAWGIALLAKYMIDKGNLTLEQYLDKVFKDYEISKYSPTKEEIDGFEKFMNKYKKGLEIEKTADRIL